MYCQPKNTQHSYKNNPWCNSAKRSVEFVVHLQPGITRIVGTLLYRCRSRCQQALTCEVSFRAILDWRPMLLGGKNVLRSHTLNLELHVLHKGFSGSTIWHPDSLYVWLTRHHHTTQSSRGTLARKQTQDLGYLSFCCFVSYFQGIL